MKNTIILPNSLGILSIDNVLNQAVTENLIPKSTQIEYDFKKLSFIDATGITVFSNLIEWLRSKRIAQSFINLKPHSTPIRFLDDSLFFERYLKAKLSKDAKPRDTTIPLKLIKHANSHLWVERDCINWLAARLQISRKALIEIKICLLELFNNIRDHSGVDTGCVFIQHYPKLKKIVISLSDFGSGIPANVKKVHPNISDGDAVLLALNEGFTTQTTNRNRGVGLHLLAQTIVSNGGSMAIRSGAAHIHCEKAYKNDLSKYSGYYAGTLFEISLRTDHFDASLADEEEFEW